MKKVVLSLMVLGVSILLVGCSLGGTKTKIYSSNGIKITMDEGFNEKDLLSTTVYLESEKAIMTALKESFKDLSVLDISKDSKLGDYIKLVLANNKMDKDYKVSDDGKYAYFTYEKEISGKSFYYQATVYKGSDAFWLVNFACLKSEKDDYKQKFLDWADTVVVE